MNQDDKIKAYRQMSGWLLAHEEDIADSINDFGDLRLFFEVWFGRPPKHSARFDTLQQLSALDQQFGSFGDAEYSAAPDVPLSDKQKERIVARVLTAAHEREE